MPVHTDDPIPPTFGQRVKRARERAGLTRPVLGGQVGRSAEWVKALENGRFQMPRLPMLLKLADVLGVEDLSELTGDERLSSATYGKAAHTALSAVKAALTSYRFNSSDEEPESADALAARVRQAWQMWHGFGDHRTRIAILLPDLLADCQYAARALEGKARRRALVALAQTYHLAQLYLSFQPAPELVMLTGDRSMTAAQDADDPHAIAAAAWYMNHVFRDAGERHEARVDLAMKAADLLDRERGPEDLALWGLLHLAAALSYAKVGRRGDAERYWDRASEAAKRLGDGYAHEWLIFGKDMVDAYAITMYTDLVRSGPAVEVAKRIDLAPMRSATRRSFHLVESARACHLQGEDVAVVHLLKKAYKESPETVRFNLFTRSAVVELATGNNTMIRDDAQQLARNLGIPA
ncbi:MULTISPECIES: helix-turn-helix domain-containing protein [Streptomyces]|jgi:transcriptional regulator with XRE-family HTH domain|uniref:HTH cro/C1-type domain-containing protein n=2 Tax=Streptomyces TaxID=1883 RepID=A0ABN1SUN0_9ACTN|nr:MULTISPECIES: helix-turn-helix transcriptional regulator [Streptomyces]MDN5385134.1 helix-turn-helix transcriptional regulator [Streptomyces sp. LB8]GAT80326.1 DNA-binding protein [Streptomyces sp. F-3]